jgi:hypothetical protein
MLDTGIDYYSRAFQFDIALTDGVRCAQVLQRDSTGAATTNANIKVHEAGAPRMSLWLQDSMNGPTPSLDPAAGSTRSSDDTWLQLPEGTAGDDVIRNFYRGGRFVTIALFSDTACATPAVLEGKSEFTVDMDGVPPVWSALPSMPWGDLAASTKGALQGLTLASGVSSGFDMAWTFAEGSTGFGEATFCVSGECGQGGSGRLGQEQVRPGAGSVHLTLRGPDHDVGAGDMKMLMLGGRDGAGMNIESGWVTCANTQVEGGWCK